MLDLVLYKGFVNNFQEAYKGTTEYVDDFCNYFLRNLKKFRLITNYRDLDDLKKNSENSPLLELIIEQLPVIVLMDEMTKNNSALSFPVNGSPFKLFLTDQSNQYCELNRKRFGLEYLNVHNLSDRWKLYFSHNPLINRKTTQDTDVPDEFRFDSWDKLRTFAHPLNSILIVDYYLLKWKVKNDFHLNLKNNIIPMLVNLLAQASTDIPVEILIISQVMENQFLTPAERIKYSKETIESELRKNSILNVNLSIVIHDKANYPSELEAFHDRAIFTNYFYIESGMGFSLFKDKGFRKKVTGNTEMKFRFNFNVQNIFSLHKDLKNINTYCKKLTNCPLRKDYLNYYPGKECRLLNY